VNVAGDQQWGDDVVDIETFLTGTDQALYRLYVPFPPSGQILRYDPTADGGGFSAPNPYFVSEGEDVSSFRQLLVDGDVYAVTSDEVLRYFSGRRSGFDLADPPDGGDLRPEHDYQLIGATGSRGVGNLYLWDAEHGRILVFDKTEGTYAGQFVSAPGAASLDSLTGMYVIDTGSPTVPPVLMYVTADGLYRLTLAEPDEIPSTPPTTAGPSATPPPEASPTAGPSDEPASPTPEPTQRPRRTPIPR
jgi:hypothetical protein